MQDVCESCGQEDHTIDEELVCQECRIEGADFLVDRLSENEWS